MAVVTFADLGRLQGMSLAWWVLATALSAAAEESLDAVGTPRTLLFGAAPWIEYNSTDEWVFEPRAPGGFLLGGSSNYPRDQWWWPIFEAAQNVARTANRWMSCGDFIQAKNNRHICWPLPDPFCLAYEAVCERVAQPWDEAMCTQFGEGTRHNKDYCSRACNRYGRGNTCGCNAPCFCRAGRSCRSG